MTDKFNQHIEKAILTTVRKSDLDCKDKEILKLYIKRHFSRVLSKNIDDIVDKLVARFSD